MGGNALNIENQRMSKEAYFKLLDELLPVLKTVFPDVQMEPTKAYRSKESYGDIDILVNTGQLPTDWHEQVVKTLSPSDWFSNHKKYNEGLYESISLSFEFKNQQVDLIPVKPEVYQFCNDYLSYNVLGMLLGRLAKRNGIEMSMKGFNYPLPGKFHKHYGRKTLISADFKAALSFFDLDVKRFEAGFDTPEEVYAYVVTSPYFDIEDYLPENRNYKAKTGECRHPLYEGFVEWCQARLDTIERDETVLGKTQEQVLTDIYAAFPDFLERYQALEELHDRFARVQRKYNGGVVSRVTGLKGKELGDFMMAAQQSFDPTYTESFELMNTFFDPLSVEEVEQWVVNKQKEFGMKSTQGLEHGC